ncbi:MAG: helix-turn-helix transcriptional regulator [Acidobacteria bacterium]|nr:helix-turn-helix transcriptional regulator [Acidobacteriota bacterium]
MPSATTFATHEAQYALVEVCLPGESPLAVGVVVCHPQTGEYRLRFRRDWEEFAGEEAEVLAYLADDFDDKLREFGFSEWLRMCQESWSNTVRISDTAVALSADLDRTASRLYQQHVRPKVLEFHTHLPLYSARVAAGRFLEDNEVDAEDWLEMPADLRLDPGMFVVRITGRSMEPRIPDGSLCVFRAGVTGSRQGKLLLIERRDVSESGGRYTVKRYRSEKATAGEAGEWRHSMIHLEPLNPEFEAWTLEDDPDAFRVIGEFVRVLED